MTFAAARALRSDCPQAVRFLATDLQSAVGTGAALAAVTLLAYDLAGSAWGITAVLIAEMLPVVALGAALGALSDRMSRKRCAIAGDLLRAVAFAAMAFASSTAQLAFAAALAGVGTALFFPAIFGAMPGMFGRHLPAASALHSAGSSLGMTLGPAIAAGALLVTGLEAMLLVNSLSFLVSAAVLATLDLDRAAPAAEAPDEAEGRSDATVVRTVLLCSTAIVCIAGAWNVGEVVLADVLGAGASGYAVLVAAFGAGTVLGSLIAGRASEARAWRRTYVAGLGLVVVSALGTAVVPGLALVTATFLIGGTANGLVVVAQRLLLTHHVVPATRGRVFGRLEGLTSGGFLTAFLAGGAAFSALDARQVYALTGVAALLVLAVGAGVLLGDRRRTPTPQPA